MKLLGIVDSHVHTDFSDDCETPAHKNIETALTLGLSGLIFTDHIDFDYPNPAYTFIFDAHERKKQFHALQKQYGSTLHIGIGVELGFQPQTIAQSDAFIRAHTFDFVINSIHVVDHHCLFSSKTFYETKTKKEAYTRYLEMIQASVHDFKNYDIVGHIGYIRRYGPYDDRTMPYHEYAPLLDEILKTVIADDKGIEVNTSGYDYNLCGPIPNLDIIQRYKELGGKIITIGSDAHKAEHVGRHFQRCLDIVRMAGFSEIAYFKERSPHFIQL